MSLTFDIEEFGDVIETAEAQFGSDAYWEQNEDMYAAQLLRYAPDCLKVLNKEKQLVPLTFNRAQLYVHERLEEQREKTGKVRALILKGRQQGISTYVSARFYHKVQFNIGVNAFILSHEDKSTKHLAGMAYRYWQNTPIPYRPTLTKRFQTVMEFGGMDAGYDVGTAKSDATGRSRTPFLFHGSEVAFWSTTHDHAGGAMQGVPNARGSEIILESTANGMQGMFYERWQDAEKGADPEYIAIFVPWFWQDEYRLPVPEDFVAEPDEVKLAESYGLDDEQIWWRRAKVKELGGESRFKQEYPCNSTEAFQTSGADVMISGELVAAARKRKIDVPEDENDMIPIILGVDCARGGKDRTKILDRQGRRMGQNFNITMHTTNAMEIAGRIARCFDEGAQHCYIDVGMDGGPVADRLGELGYGDMVTKVDFGSAAEDDDRYFNKRTEIWARYRDWLKDAAGVQVPDDDTFHRHSCACPYTHDAAQRQKLMPKEFIKKHFKFSPDEGDAAALTFTERYAIKTDSEVRRRLARHRRNARGTSRTWKTG